MTREEYNREYKSLANARDMAVKVNDKKVAKHYRQQISRLYEDHGKYMSDSSPVVDQAEQDRLDAERYRKLKREIWGQDITEFLGQRGLRPDNFDDAVDALPDVAK